MDQDPPRRKLRKKCTDVGLKSKNKGNIEWQTTLKTVVTPVRKKWLKHIYIYKHYMSALANRAGRVRSGLAGDGGPGRAGKS